MLGGASRIREMIPSFHINGGWDAKHPDITYGQVEALINMLGGEENVFAVLNGRKIVQIKDTPSGKVEQKMKGDYFASVATDEKTVTRLVSSCEYNVNAASYTVAMGRALADDLDYTGPVFWRVKVGFTLKSHTPLAGPCYEKFAYLQDWNLQNDESTADCMVFFIPRIIATGKNAGEQKQALVELRAKYGLPTKYLSSFGSAALVSGLILAHFKRTGERAPLNTKWVRTDTLSSDGGRLNLGGFDGIGLRCCSGHWDDNRGGSLGVFPLGVVKIAA